MPTLLAPLTAEVFTSKKQQWFMFAPRGFWSYQCSRFSHAAFFSTLSRVRQPQFRTISTAGAKMDAPPGIENKQPIEVDAPVDIDGKPYDALREGLATILRPSLGETGKRDGKANEPATVFYNPIQQFNRDLSVLAVRVYAEHLLAVRREKLERKRRHEKPKGKKRKREDDAGDQQKTEESDKNEEKAEQAARAWEEHKAQSFRILDALSASGLRALRYSKEVQQATTIVANDMSRSAVETIRTNIRYNGVQNVHVNQGDARAYMYSLLSSNGNKQNPELSIGRFDVIDLDPYGTAVPFLDAAVQAVSDGGLLCITCTDAGVYASAGYPEKTYSLYGGEPVRGPHGHEAGLRLILHAVAAAAAKYGLAVEPLLSLSIDYYARVFVRVTRSPAQVKFLAGNTMLVYSCDSGCGAWTTQPLCTTRSRIDRTGQPFYHYSLAQAPQADRRCEHCGFKTHLAGPMWAGPLHNQHFIRRILALLPSLDHDTYGTTDRIEGMLTTALEEDLNYTEDDASSSEASKNPIIPRATDPAHPEPHPFYVNLAALSKVLHTQTIPQSAFRGALARLNYKTTRSHTKPNTVRTDAPWSVIWTVMCEWVRQRSPIRPDALSPGSAGAGIMRKYYRYNLPQQQPPPQQQEEVEQQEHQGESQDEILAALRREVTDTASSATSTTDLVTKLEALLYRNLALTARRPQSAGTVSEGGDSQTGDDAAAEEKKKKEEEEKHKNIEVVFDEALGEKLALRKKGLVRYKINPENWGPMSKAAG